MAGEVTGTVLCVDDNRDNLQSMSWILQLEGFKVLEAASGAEALCLVERMPDLVILDVRLSDMSGFDVCRQLKTTPETANLPVLMLSGYFVQGRHRIHGLEGGADAYLTKPVEPRELLAHVKSALRARRAEQAARAAAQQWQMTFDAVSDGICLLDADATIRRCNRAMAELLGGAPDDFLGKPYRDVQRAALGVATGPPFGRVPDRVGREFEEVRAGDRWFHVTLDPARDDANHVTGAVLVWADITARKQSEAAVRQAEAKFRDIFENAIEGIFQLTPAGRVLTANPALARMLGCDSPGELLAGAGAAGLRPALDRLQDFVRRLDEHGVDQGYEVQLPRKDGKTVWVKLSGRAVRDATGAVAYYEGWAEDIQERKRLEEQFLQAQRMEAVGRLAGGVAHDFNNLLTIVYSCSELLLDAPGLDPGARHLVDEIRAAGRRAAALTQQLLAFSRKQMLTPKALDLNAVVGELTPMLRRLIRSDIELTTDLDRAAGQVKADPGQIEQVLMNLAVNAKDAMPQGGTLTVATRAVTLTADDVAARPEIRPGPYVRLSVADTGCGMDAATRARVFEPFFTTKEVGKGTGLGLATVYGIVKQSGGHVEVRSQPDRGSTFEIYLPSVGQPAAPPAPRPEPPADLPPARGDETILLVEDEPSVRATVRTVLHRCGYHVMEARDGIEALQRFEEPTAGPIHLLVTDVVMPHLSGRQLADLLRPHYPGLRVLFITGYTEDAVLRDGVQGENLAVLPKPFLPADLARKVRAMLDQPAS
jgi:PAS domain S-box-containing protein